MNAIPVSPTNYCTLTDGVTPVTTDQRAVSRPQGLGCDVGAFELQGVPDTSTTLSASASPSTLGQTVTLTATVLSLVMSSSAIVLHATAVTMLSTVIGAPESPGNANPDRDFRFDSTLGASGGYIFNLGTNGLGSATYGLQFTATGDAVVHSVGFGVN